MKKGGSMETYQFKYLKDFYISPSLHAPRKELLKSIYRGRYYRNLYLITLANHPRNIAEIISLKQMINLRGVMKIPEIIGLALSRQEAVELLIKILEETKIYEKDFGFRKLFSPKMISYKEEGA